MTTATTALLVIDVQHSFTQRPTFETDGLPAYLETQKESNVPWYARFGFELTHTVRRPGTPLVWCMTRPAG